MQPHDSLPPVWVIGFTGHRHLRDAASVSEAINQLLRSLREEIRGELMGYSSIAIGADTLFAEACLSLNIPWTAILPRPAEDFKSDFSETEWKEAAALLSRAVHVECIAPVKHRDVGYLECGLATVEESDVMIAVWDGELSRGLGGTADIIAHARTLGKPLILLNPATLQVTRENFSADLFRDDELEELNKIGAALTTEPGTGRRARIISFFDKVDRHAAHLAPRFRGWIGASVLMNAAAAILTTAGVTLALKSQALNVAILLLVTAATLAVAVMKRKQAHARWVRCRIAAEICRSALATWPLREFTTPFWFEKLEGFSRLTKSLRSLRLMDAEVGEADLDKMRSEYLRVRVEQQLGYFKKRRVRLRLALGICIGAFWTFSAIAIARSFVAVFFLRAGSGALAWNVVHSFLPIALPLAAGCALSLMSIFDLNRQLARTMQMIAVLNSAQQRVAPAQNLASFRRAVEHAENACAFELFEWSILHRYPRFN